jgi:GNAT acetyltransferase-like protein
LRRTIPGFEAQDGMGCYPLFSCRDWSLLPVDMDALRGDLVSLALVADPFGNYDVAQLEACFDVVVPYKSHFVVDVRQPAERFVSQHHRRAVRKALREVEVEPYSDPLGFLDEWTRLYANVVEKYEVTGIRAFSRETFAKQLTLPGTVLFRAMHDRKTVAADWYCVQEDVAYAHLAACTPRGYRIGAAYALQWTAITYFADKVRWINLGGGAGLAADGRDGLSRFKQGWSTGTRNAYFCGRILDGKKYEQIVRAKGTVTTDYFPAYRAGEFG